MVKLTEEMIVARTRVSDMANVKKLNCWGAELTDVTVIRKLINVEVLSLSVNCITTLADIQNCKNLQELYIRKNRLPDINEIGWLRDLTKLKNLWLEDNPFCQNHQELYRATVIRNLPQLQKLDNVVVQPDEVAESMRRGIELVHPLDTDETIPYNYGGGPPSYQPPIGPGEGMGSRRDSRASIRSCVDDQHSQVFEDKRSSESDQYSCPSRRVSNQVFDPPITSVGAAGPSGPDFQQRASPPSYQGGYMVRNNSTPNSQSHYAMEDGYVPDYHTGRRYSNQQEQAPERVLRRSSRNSQPPSVEEPMRRMSMQDVNSYEDERNANSFSAERQQHRQSVQETYQQYDRYEYSRNNASPTPMSDARNVVAAHYEQTYEQVDQQIASAQQLIEERRLRTQASPDRPYPRRPKNRNSNILSAVLCLIKELDAPSLEVAEMAIRCRMEELED